MVSSPFLLPLFLSLHFHRIDLSSVFLSFLIRSSLCCIHYSLICCSSVLPLPSNLNPKIVILIMLIRWQYLCTPKINDFSFGMQTFSSCDELVLLQDTATMQYNCISMYVDRLSKTKTKTYLYVWARIPSASVLLDDSRVSRGRLISNSDGTGRSPVS